MEFKDLKVLKYGDIKAIFDKKKYAFFDNGIANLNIFGVRIKTGTNVFDDAVCVAYRDDNGKPKLDTYMATTDPGMAYLFGPLSNEGTAILVPGQYRGAYGVHHHQGKYLALCQRKPVAVYRDNNKDAQHDMNPLTKRSGIYGINIHRSNSKTESTYIDKWSAGCQVFKKVKDYDEFMALVTKAKNLYSNSFTYTLLEAKDFDKQKPKKEPKTKVKK